MPRNQIIVGGWVLEKLVNQDDVLLFDCGDRDLNDYFHKDSIGYRNELMTQSYCFYPEGGSQKECVALVDFCNDSLSKDTMSNSSIK